MIKIIFVCHGNICRSPMAQFVMQHIARERGLEDRLFIRSAGTSSEEIWNGVGNPVYPPAARELKKHGIACTGHHARQVTRHDYTEYDLLIVMEGYNLRNLMRITGGDPDGKIFKLLDFTPEGGDIDDPWYTGDFSGVYAQITDGCEGLIRYLKEKGSI